MAVPASFNDVAADAAVRDHVGDIWYQRTVRVPRGVPLRIATDGFLNLPDQAMDGEGPGYRVRLEGAFNALNVQRRR